MAWAIGGGHPVPSAVTALTRACSGTVTSRPGCSGRIIVVGQALTVVRSGVVGAGSGSSVRLSAGAVAMDLRRMSASGAA